LRAILIQIAAVLTSAPAVADELFVANDTAYEINRLMIPRSGEAPSVDILRPGETIKIGDYLRLEYFPVTHGCVFDIWAKFSNETVKSILGYNACELTDPSNEDKWAIFTD